MGKIVLYALLSGTACAALFRPWIGIVVSYIFIILTPQNIWWWHFEGIRPVLFVLLPTIVGVIFSLGSKKLNLQLLWNARNISLLILWFAFVFSYFWGPYTHVSSELRPFDAKRILFLVNNIFILYFMACICIDDKKKLRILVWVLGLSTIYLIYWINDQYLFQGKYGRIGGPSGPYGGSIYRDENAIAMLYVVGIPFLYYLGHSCTKKLFRYALWLIIPLGWHAIFLTGSRGGLLGLGVTILIISFRARKKVAAFFLIPAAIFAFYWQGGPVMQERAGTITEYQSERSAASRIEAWSVAVEMIMRYPLTGVGLTSFIPAFSDHSHYDPREAHNTFFQIAAETGVIGGGGYLLVLWFTVRGLLRNAKLLRGEATENLGDNIFLVSVNEAVLVSFLGLITCSLFLSLHVYELFYFLCLLANAISYLCSVPGDRHQETVEVQRFSLGA